MKKNEIYLVINTKRKGAFFKMIHQSIKQVKGYEIVKITEGIYRIGINYYNIKENKNKEIKPMLWGENVEGYENYLIQYKNNLYLKVYTTKHKSKSVYFLNGEPIEKSKLIEMGLIKPSNPTTRFNINIENILAIN